MLQWEYNSSQYFWRCTRYSLTSEFQMKPPFDSFSINDFWKTTGSLSKYLRFTVSESKKFLHIVLLTLNFWTSHIPMFNYVLSGLVTPGHHQVKVEALVGVPDIEIDRISLIHLPYFLSMEVLCTSIKSLPWWSAVFFSLGLDSFPIAEIKVANSYYFFHFSSINRSRYSFMMKNRTGTCCA